MLVNSNLILKLKNPPFESLEDFFCIKSSPTPFLPRWSRDCLRQVRKGMFPLFIACPALAGKRGTTCCGRFFCSQTPLALRSAPLVRGEFFKCGKFLLDKGGCSAPQFCGARWVCAANLTNEKIFCSFESFFYLTFLVKFIYYF